MANCLVPSDPSIRVIAQDRNVNQSFYQLDYSQADDCANVRQPPRMRPSPAGWKAPAVNRYSKRFSTPACVTF